VLSLGSPDGRTHRDRRTFRNVAGVARNGLARLNPDVRSIRASTRGRVFALWSRAWPCNLMAKSSAWAYTVVNETAFPYVARVDGQGGGDSSFHPGVADFWNFRTVAVQADGKILLGGASHQTPFGGILVRLLPNGTLDPAFQIGAGADGEIFSIAVQNDGSLFVEGFSAIMAAWLGPAWPNCIQMAAWTQASMRALLEPRR